MLCCLRCRSKSPRSGPPGRCVRQFVATRPLLSPSPSPCSSRREAQRSCRCQSYPHGDHGSSASKAVGRLGLHESSTPPRAGLRSRVETPIARRRVGAGNQHDDNDEAGSISSSTGICQSCSSNSQVSSLLTSSLGTFNCERLRP